MSRRIVIVIAAFVLSACRAQRPEPPPSTGLKIYEGNGRIRNATPEEDAAYRRDAPKEPIPPITLPSGKPATRYISANGYEDATDSDGNHYVRRGFYWVPAPPGR